RVVHERRVLEGGGVLGAAELEVGLVDDEQRRAVGAGELAHVHSGDTDHAVRTAERVAGPHLRVQPVDLVRTGRRETCLIGVRVDLGVRGRRGVCTHSLLTSGRGRIPRAGTVRWRAPGALLGTAPTGRT